MKHRLPIFAATLAFLLAGAQARAGISWQYDFTPVGGSSVITSDNGHSTLVLTNQPNYSAVNNSDVIATHLGANSTAPDSAPDTFKNEPYTLKMILKDTASGASTTLTFGGMISGWVSAHSTNTTNVFTMPTSYMDIHLGHNIYSVVIGPYTGPGPGGALDGSIGAHVTVRGDGSGGGPNNTPEPGTMVLAGMGAVSLLAGRWRRRRTAL